MCFNEFHFSPRKPLYCLVFLKTLHKPAKKQMLFCRHSYCNHRFDTAHFLKIESSLNRPKRCFVNKRDAVVQWSGQFLRGSLSKMSGLLKVPPDPHVLRFSRLARSEKLSGPLVVFDRHRNTRAHKRNNFALSYFPL